MDYTQDQIEGYDFARLERKIIRRLHTYPALNISSLKSVDTVARHRTDQAIQRLIDRGILKTIYVHSGNGDNKIELFYLAEASQYIEGFVKHFEGDSL